MEEALKLIYSFAEKLKAGNLEVSLPVKGDYFYEIQIVKGSVKLKLRIYFGKKGLKPVIQGNKDSGLFKEVNEIITGQSSLLFDDKNKLDEPESYIGTDESGKGDYFGPLVVAGVFAGSAALLQLKSIGVKDSKLLSEYSIKNLSGSIKKIVGKNGYNILAVNPPKYNELYTKIKNVNRLLAWGHAKVIENILELSLADTVISDKFGDEKLILSSLQEKGRNVLLRQETKAEKYTAVAAASILARNTFDEWFNTQKTKLKLDIPKGASGSVEIFAKQIKNKYGESFLVNIAKLHFKTTKKL